MQSWVQPGDWLILLDSGDVRRATKEEFLGAAPLYGRSINHGWPGSGIHVKVSGD